MNPASFVLLALLAQTTPPTASPEDKAKAQTLLKEGAKLYEKGSVAEAYEKFSQAYEAYKSPKLLFNIGQTSRDLGRLAEAMDAFTHFLAEDTNAPEEITAEANKSVAELQSKLGRLRIECANSGAEISLDGKLVGHTPIADLIWSMPGSHQVTASHANMLPSIENIEVKPGWMHTVVMTLQPLAKVAPTASAIPPAPAPVVEPEATVEPEISHSPTQKPAAAADDGWWLGKKWAWVASGATIVFAGTATILGVSMQSKFDSLNKSCGSGAPAAGGTWTGCSDSDVNDVILRRNLANVGWGLTAVAAATAGVLFIVEGRSVSVAPIAGEATGLVVGMAY